MKPNPRFLVIRRDNIGDLVCTTPMFSALRQRFPEARIDALVNSYNADVLAGNPDLDRVYQYTKAKHRRPGQTVLEVYLGRLRLFSSLRHEGYDYAIVAGAHCLPRALRLARAVAPRHIIAFTEPGCRGARAVDMPVLYDLPRPLHEVEDIFRLLAPLGIEGRPGPLTVVPDAAERSRALEAARRLSLPQRFPRLVALHISARKASQRLPIETFARLAQALHARYGMGFVLLWSPGDENNPLHPGDDRNAAALAQMLPDLPLLPYPTHRLAELVAALSICDAAILSDGGAMHIAAGLGLPILCFFGRSDPRRWHPWGVPHVILQPPSRDVAELSVEVIQSAWEALLQACNQPHEGV